MGRRTMAELNQILSRQERWRQGKALQDKVPWESHSNWKTAKNRPEPIETLLAQDKGRLQHLIPIKYGRMSTSPFAFLRGSAAVMAADLANTPKTGIETMLCGDAHVSNFGIFATPERQLVFDINDFDECYPGPWEWDLKRLAASAVVAGRENGFKPIENLQMAELVAKTYRKAMKEFTELPTLDVWYYHVNVNQLLKMFNKYSKKGAKIAKNAVKKARTKTQKQTLKKLTKFVNGRYQFVSNFPLILRFSDVLKTDILTDEEKAKTTEENLEKAWFAYLKSLPDDKQTLLSRFHVLDGALRVVGVGSVGTRCAVLLLKGGGDNDMIVLQQKEAGPSVLERHLPHKEFVSQAERVVTGQKLMQAASDIFLGWSHGIGSNRQYYWRQLKDMKGSIDMALLDVNGFASYLTTCSRCLARAHARAGSAARISGYLDHGSPFDEAIAKFAVSYADQTNRDYQALMDAIASGRIVAQTDL
jgi:uncharacterized protein (DUF2252 family)